MKHRTKLLAALALAAGVFGVVSPASAAVYNWTYTGSIFGTNVTSDVEHGTLTTGGSTPGYLGQPGGVAITGITGTVDIGGTTPIGGAGFVPGSYTITGIVGNTTCCSYPANNNVLYPAGPVYLDLAGVGLSSYSSFDENLYWNGETYEDLQGPPHAGTFISEGSFSISPVPEPKTYGMLLAGLALVAVTLRRRKAEHFSA